MMCIVKNCKICSDYQCEEIGDSDYGAIYSETPSCQKYKDYNDSTDEFIKGFDYEKERECCSIDFFKVMEEDEELNKMFYDEMDRTDDCNDTHLYFKEKYKLS